MFAGLVDGGAPGNVGVCVWGAKPADPKVVAHIANLLGAPAPAQTTSVCVRGYPAQLGLAVDEYVQLRRYAQDLGHANCPPSQKHRWQTSICVWCWCQHQMVGSVGSF